VEIDIKELINNLRCRYATGPYVENGEPEFGYRDMSCKMEVELPTPIMLKAADAFEYLQDRLRAAEAELSAVTAQRDELLAALKSVRLHLLNQSQYFSMQQVIESAEKVAADAIAKCEVGNG